MHYLRPRGSPSLDDGSRARTIRRRLFGGFLAVLALVLTVFLAPGKPASGASFDFDTGNAFLEVFLPRGQQAFALPEAPAPSDASIVLRITTIIDGSMYDAIAPYDPNGTAVGVYTRLGHRPVAERTQRNKNIAILYAAYRTSMFLLPSGAATWNDVLTSVGLDPNNNSTDTTTPIGIGNVAGNTWVAKHMHDGMNQLGDEGGVKYNGQRYADYTGYQPVNTAYKLTDPSRWQPLVTTTGNGVFKVQQFVTPQTALLTPFSYPRSLLTTDPALEAPKPNASDFKKHPDLYKAQADNVLAVSASLTDQQKATAELFNNKIASLGAVQFFISGSRGHTLDQFIQLAFLTNMAAYDTAIPVWTEKRKWDAVRPTSAIHFLYGNNPVTAWGGPGKGTVTDLPGNQWRSYLSTADHPEYPSGSASFCAAYAQAARDYLGDDNLNWSVPVAKGSSVIEPGVTPATDTTLQFVTLTQFETDCGQSRLYGGVHFQASIDAGKPIGHDVGERAYQYMVKLLNGTAPMR
jgi:hypothetical protein